LVGDVRGGDGLCLVDMVERTEPALGAGFVPMHFMALVDGASHVQKTHGDNPQRLIPYLSMNHLHLHGS
jgi:hypothetical protein